MSKILLFLFLSVCLYFNYITFADNIHIIDRSENGFKIYRTGAPKNKKEMKELCNHYKIEEIYVLSGNAEDYENTYKEECPNLKVIYNEEQDATVPLSSSFLMEFDEWVNEAQIYGKTIAIRCNCGCHRTGRLAAYYQMKYKDFTPEQAISKMNKYDKWHTILKLYLSSFIYPSLDDQVYALYDYILNKPCSTIPDACVISEY
jgi:protein-tyrosine phosphatase